MNTHKIIQFYRSIIERRANVRVDGVVGPLEGDSK